MGDIRMGNMELISLYALMSKVAKCVKMRVSINHTGNAPIFYVRFRRI